MIKLIAVDLDGTLLKDDNKISVKTKEVIKRVADLGIYVILATGRPYKVTSEIQKELGIDHPMILHNGAIVKSFSGQLTYSKPISIKKVKEFVDYCNEKEYTCSIIFNDCEEIYMNKVDYFTYGIHVNCNNTIPIVRKKLEELPTKPITKILVTDKNSRFISEANEDLLKKFSTELNILKSGNWYIDIANKDISKGIVLKYIAESLKISPKNIMAIGDSRNDVGMLEYANVSVAMGNAEDFVKERADYVTLSNNDDGVYEAIKKFINVS